MPDYQSMILFLALSGIAAAVIASGIALGICYFTQRDKLAVLFGACALPLLILAGMAYWIMSMEPDDAPPGVVMMGNLLLLATVTPIGLLASHLSVRFLKPTSRRD